jgi:hypothetical protein
MPRLRYRAASSPSRLEERSLMLWKHRPRFQNARPAGCCCRVTGFGWRSSAKKKPHGTVTDEPEHGCGTPGFERNIVTVRMRFETVHHTKVRGFYCSGSRTGRPQAWRSMRSSVQYLTRW